MIWFYSLLASVSAVAVEAMYKSGMAFWRDWQMIPLILAVQIGIWGLYSHSRSFFGAVLLFSVINAGMRILVGSIFLKEKLTLNVAIAFVLLIIANLIIKK